MDVEPVIKLNLGSGDKKIPGYLSIDNDKITEPDFLVDLEKDNLPLKDGEVTEILAFNLLEHISNLKHLMEECYRVLKPEGTMRIIVPHYMHHSAYDDPDHIRVLTPYFFYYFSREYYGSDGRQIIAGDMDFVVKDIIMHVDSEAKKKYPNSRQMQFASQFLWNSIQQMEVILSPVKPCRPIRTDIRQTYLGRRWCGYV